MKVKLLRYTNEPLRTIYIAARTCYSGNTPEEIAKGAISRKTMESLVKKLVRAGHHSILEHVSFTFAISGISRACSHQLVRHRIASYSQQSQRYTKPNEFVIPKTIEAQPDLKSKFINLINKCFSFYDELQKNNIPLEDARFILPNAIKTNIVMTMNLRELIHAASLRLCNRAQWEIRELFGQIKAEIAKVDKFLAEMLVPKCEHLGCCPEPDSCGKEKRCN